jgi:hypothetical protein
MPLRCCTVVRKLELSDRSIDVSVDVDCVTVSDINPRFDRRKDSETRSKEIATLLDLSE